MNSTHIVFGYSAAKSLRDALAEAGKAEVVIAFPDDLSQGPIDPPRWSERARWMADELDHEHRDLKSEIDAFWNGALASGISPVAWFSRRSAREYANFLEWLWRMDNSPCQIVDLSDVRFPCSNSDGRTSFVVSAAVISSNAFQKLKPWEKACDLSQPDRERYRRLWRSLKAENAPLRILRDGDLTSAPIDVFDTRLLALVSSNWRKMSRVIGEAWAVDYDDEVQQVGDAVLQARLRALVKSGIIEGRGNLHVMRDGEVRISVIPSAT
jgi:Protein of unknown function/Domain of unknown function (DUF1835)